MGGVRRRPAKRAWREKMEEEIDVILFKVKAYFQKIFIGSQVCQTLGTFLTHTE